MCGIAGFLTEPAPGAELRAIASAMASILHHRGPDDAGVWVDEALGVALAHRRLSILDLSRAGHQPMASASGRWVISFNGEAYNFAELRRDLERHSVRFRGGSDTEVFVEAVDAWGLDAAIERINGMFAVALWDCDQRTLHLARDRLGEKPLYYGLADRSFLFASELKALRTYPGFRPEIDRGALALFMRHNYVPAPHTIYEGISKLPAGCIVSLPLGRRNACPSPRTYWSAKQVAEDGSAQRLAIDPNEAADELERLLLDSVRLRMVADVPVGAFLSGGIDSSVVVALMQMAGDRPTKTFTIGFHEERYDEAVPARAVARHLGTDHTELYVTPAEAQEVIPSLPDVYDEPFADSSQIPTMLVARLARSDVIVSLSGDGGDELFGGYTRYAVHKAYWRWLGWCPAPLRFRLGQALQLVPPHTWDAFIPRLGPLGRGAVSTHPGEKVHKLGALLQLRRPEHFYLQLVSQWDPSALVLGAREPTTAVTDPAMWARLADSTERLMHMDLITYLPEDILAKVDRATMAVGLEARLPLLDHRLVEWSWRLPTDLKIRGAQGKWILRQLLARHVPPALTERPKMGFGVPIGDWLRGSLRPWAEDLLDRRRLANEGFFDPEPIHEKWSQHQSGSLDWKYLLWDVLMFQAWLERKSTY